MVKTPVFSLIKPAKRKKGKNGYDKFGKHVYIAELQKKERKKKKDVAYL